MEEEIAHGRVDGTNDGHDPVQPSPIEPGDDDAAEQRSERGT